MAQVESATRAERSLRIAHLSDLHAKPVEEPDNFGQERVVKALLADLDNQADNRPIDIIVFSGDLAFDGVDRTPFIGPPLLRVRG